MVMEVAMLPVPLTLPALNVPQKLPMSGGEETRGKGRGGE